jgi:two-component system, OmpR family, sensor histidine kinase VicK
MDDHNAGRSHFAEQYLAAIVQSAADAIISKDLNGIVTSWNPAAERIYGYSAEEIIGQSIMRIIPPDLIDEENQLLARIRNGCGLQPFETTRVRKDGATIHISLTVSPI